MSPQKVVISDQLDRTLAEAIAECEHDKVFVLADETTVECCLPVIEQFECMAGAKRHAKAPPYPLKSGAAGLSVVAA